MPASSHRRRATTSSAEVFSATNMTVRPLARARKIRLATVWDLPVPGGPWTTRLRPATASATTRAWGESATSGRLSTTSSRSSRSGGAGASAVLAPAGPAPVSAVLAPAGPPVSRRRPTSGLAVMVGQSSARSRHMR